MDATSGNQKGFLNHYELVGAYNALAFSTIITKLNTQQTTNGEQEMRNFIKDSVKYYLAVVQGMWMPVFIIAGMQYLGYEFYLSFNSLICGVLIGLSMMSIYLLAPTSDEEE